jgi:hypothetical protein
MVMAEADDLLELRLRKQRERAVGELEGVDVRSHRFQNVCEVPAAHRRVVRASYFRDAS